MLESLALMLPTVGAPTPLPGAHSVALLVDIVEKVVINTKVINAHRSRTPVICLLRVSRAVCIDRVMHVAN